MKQTTSPSIADKSLALLYNHYNVDKQNNPLSVVGIVFHLSTFPIPLSTFNVNLSLLLLSIDHCLKSIDNHFTILLHPYCHTLNGTSQIIS